MTADSRFIATNSVQISDKEFATIQKMIYNWAGIAMNDAKKALVAGRLQKRLRFYSFQNFSDYITLIQKPEYAEEKQTMINLLTTNETYFFREPRHFDFLKDNYLPGRKFSDKLRVWNAACSTGEESYTTAMILAELYGYTGWEIIGTDINEEVVKKAIDGLYPLEDAEHIPMAYLKKYCLKGINSQEGYFTISPEIKKNIKFASLNLINPLPAGLGMFDIIFLRNVMIYFDREVKKQIIDRLVYLLKTDGILIIGHAESLHGVTSSVKTLIPTIYQRA